MHPLICTFWSSSLWCLGSLLHPLCFRSLVLYYICDDYNHVIWVYLLYNGFEVITTVTHFITKVVTQYSTTLKILCTKKILSFSKPLSIPYVLIMTISTIPLLLTPRRKMIWLSVNIVNSLISLTHYWLRCMSHLTVGLIPSWMPPISGIGFPLLPLAVLFAFTIS